MEYMGFVISYDDDDDNSYGSLPLLRFLACLVRYSLAITVNCFFLLNFVADLKFCNHLTFGYFFALFRLHKNHFCAHLLDSIVDRDDLPSQ